MCKWVLLPDRENPSERRCFEHGEPFCEEHAVELHHAWEDLRDDVDRSRREERGRKAGKLLSFPS
jgi:hypothetical protein